ncbi:ribose ABC transporter permease [Sorangium cellulosum]|uniref:Ribose ABC transporter permease n=1 Tax=Sorangium cellulosum TaxID=56 RepID=A0A4P2QAK3_SORCE|nr:ABC transporter permease [Sorangium cellulosum]AUX26308.1 ribose ABC transporter permease [Sorangium cellulosum]
MKRRPPWVGPLVALVLVYALFAALTPDTFLRSQNLLTMARQTVVVGLCAIGMTLVIATGGIDLSTGSLVAFTTVVLARLLRADVPPLPAALAATAVAGVAGVLVGTLVGRARMMPFIVTLGTMSALRGAAKGLASEQKIDADPRGLEALLTADLTAPGLWTTAALALLFSAVLAFSRFGRHVLAVGSNEAAARLCGIDTGRVKIAVYALSSLLAGVAGVMEFATLTVGDPTDSVGLELEVIAAVVIGGAPLSGGEGSVAGSMIGALLITVIRTGGVHLGLPSWVQEIATGAIIVIAVAVDRVRRARRPRVEVSR